MRLIDADALIEEIVKIQDLRTLNTKTIGEAISRTPTIEPKKGKWIPHCEMSREYFGTVLVNVEYDYWFCDACGYRVENGQPMYNFCPNCGTRMEG